MAVADDDDFGDLAALGRTLHRLDEAHRRFRGHISRTLAISPTELTALVLIADTPGLSPGALGRDLALTSGAMTALIDRLEDSGHVHREASPGDRRRLELHLTGPGRDTLRHLRSAYRSVLAGGNTDDALIRVLPQIDAIATSLNEAALDPQGP